MIERLLLEQIKSDVLISGLLTTYNGETAIFYQNAPKDTDPLWGGSCFPRVDFLIDPSRDPERKNSGSLLVNVWVSSQDLSPTGGNLETEIAELLKDSISGAFYSPENGAVIGVEWTQDSAFLGKAVEKNVDASVVETYGISLMFDLIDFPKQKTTDPDPIEGCNAFIKKNFPDMVVIGEDELPPILKPTDENPALYWRFRGYEGDVRRTYSVNWYLANLALHVFTKSIEARNTWLKAAQELMNLQGEILLLDSSPMFIHKLLVFHEGDPLREGQLYLNGEFGVLVSQRKETAQNPLNKVITKKGVEEMISCQNK